MSQATFAAEAELQRRSAQIAALARQIKITQAELHHARMHAAGGEGPCASRQAKELASGIAPDLVLAKGKIADALQVARRLDAWFVENAASLNIQDATTTPSAYLASLLETCHSRCDALGSNLIRASGSQAGTDAANTVAGAQTEMTATPDTKNNVGMAFPLANAAAGAQAMVSPNDQHAAQIYTAQSTPHHDIHLTVPRSSPGPTPAAAQPGGAGVAGMWVRDPDAA